MPKVRQKLACILLVDDDEATNFIHSMVIKKLGCTEEIITRGNGLEAMEYIKNSGIGDCRSPDLILLDINMPQMNGWEFLDAYNSIDVHKRAKAVILMLTSPLGSYDSEMAKKIGHISGFVQKPLTAESMQDLLMEFFNDP